MKRTQSTDSELPARSAPQMSSLFGQSATQAPGTTSAFPPTSSLFADLAASNKQEQKPAGSSFFPNAAASSKPEASSSLFGGSKLNSQPQAGSAAGGGGGLFGSATSQSQGSSIFANTAQPAGLSGFGSSATTAAVPSLFANAAAPAAPTASTNLFFQTQGQQQQAGQSQQQNGQTVQSGAPNTQPAFFNSLLERGKKRTHDANGGSASGDLPSLQLGLGDIARRARELGGTEPQAQRGGLPDSRA